MRPPNRTLWTAVFLGFVLAGTAAVAAGVVDSSTTEAVFVQDTDTDAVVVQNGSTYRVSQTLVFEVDAAADSYVLRTGAGDYVDQLSAENGTIILDSGLLNAGTYVLVNHTTESVAYQFALTGGETTTTTTEAPTETTVPATVAEDGATYETARRLSFEVAHDQETYILRTGEQRLYVDQLRSTDGTIELDTTGLDPGQYVLVRQSSGDVSHRFTLVGDETTTTVTRTTATTVTATTSQPPSTSAASTTESASTRGTTTVTTATPSTAEPNSTANEASATTNRSSQTPVEDTAAGDPTETTVRSETVTPDRAEQYYPSVPGFGFLTTVVAFVASGLLAVRRRR